MGDTEGSGSGVKELIRTKKAPVRLLFQFVLSLALLVLCFTLFSGSLSWPNLPLQEHYHTFLNWTKHVRIPAPRNNHPKLHFRSTAAPTVGTQFHQAYARNYHFIMDHDDLCKIRSPFLVLLVPVAPGNVEARDAIRQTWGNRTLVEGELVFTLFMLGITKEPDEQQQEKVKQENVLHQDLIQSNFVDSYINLTIKTMVIMDWMATRCPSAAYAMKVDSDMFLNVDNLVRMLHTPGIPKENYLTGMLMWNRPVVRSKDSKWYVPEEMYPDEEYPTYTLGMGYVFSNDLPERYVDVSKSITPFNIEDAYIGMCMKKLGLSPTPSPIPYQFKAYNVKYDRCEYSQIITYILGSAKELIEYWTDLKRPEPPCGG